MGACDRRKNLFLRISTSVNSPCQFYFAGVNYNVFLCDFYQTVSRLPFITTRFAAASLCRAIDRRFPLPFCFVSLRVGAAARRRPFLLLLFSSLLSCLSAPMSAPERRRRRSQRTNLNYVLEKRTLGIISRDLFVFGSLFVATFNHPPDLYLISPLTAISDTNWPYSADIRRLFLDTMDWMQTSRAQRKKK